MIGARSNQDIIQALTLFIRKLNDECRNKALVVIEGQRDANALRSIGFEGDLFLLCHNGSLTKLASKAEKYKKIVLLLDLDRKGRVLTKRTATILQEKNSNIDLFFRRELAKVTKGRIRHIEELARFGDHLQNLVIGL
ncbi:MAG: toprim domain-containing protein [Nitrososphaerales archaeon]|nr:toprim domain-containing protein [Nitrososphaerales archaeon]